MCRRADFIEWTGCESFPCSFSGTRWLEDIQVAQRALDLWGSITVYVDKVSAGPNSRKPKCASFINVQRVVKGDSTIVAKLHFFIRVAKILKPFLEKFQSNNPMMPFVEQELLNVLKSLLENFVKPSKLGDSPTLLEMFSVDLEEESNLIECRKVTIGLGAKEEILRLTLSEQKMREFKSECLKCYKAITEKLKSRFGMETIDVLTNLSALSPRFIFNHPNKSISRFENLLIYLIRKKLVKSERGDQILSQYKDVNRKVRSERKHESLEYAPTKTRLDSFFNELIGGDPEYAG